LTEFVIDGRVKAYAGFESEVAGGSRFVPRTTGAVEFDGTRGQRNASGTQDAAADREWDDSGPRPHVLDRVAALDDGGSR